MPPPPTFATKHHTPPGPNLALPTSAHPSPPSNPPIFNDAMTVRLKVFVEEQHVPAESEIDEDDARSWEWVVYSTLPSNISHLDTNTNNNNDQGPNNNTPEEQSPIARPVPVGVIRLVPPPHAPHESLIRPDLKHPKYDVHHEPYIKLTRVAVLPEFRGNGLGRDLVSTALEWASRNSGAINAAYAAAAAAVSGFVNDIQGEGKGDGEGERKTWKGLVLVHAQMEVEKMYSRLGFSTDEEMGRWDEEGIEHVGMWKRMELVD